jgi:hypothetical protein
VIKRLNQSVKSEHFKMEGIHMLKDRRLDGQNRCVFHDPHGTRGPKVPQISMGLPVQLPAIWSDHGSFTKTTWPVLATLRELGLRYIDDILVIAETERPYHSSDIPAGEPGVRGKPPQISADPHPGNLNSLGSQPRWS